MTSDVDVILLAENSHDHFAKYIDSVIDTIPVNQLIVVDGGSADGTIEFLKKKLPGTVKVIEDRRNRSTARQKGIEALINEVPAVMSYDYN